jgi:DNA-binding CsgD family transcriptional regulator
MSENPKLPISIFALILLQCFCAVFFLADVIADFEELRFGVSPHLYVETVASFSLVAAIFFEVKFLMRLLRRKSRLERSLAIASSAVHDVIEMHFDEWKLTGAEQDIAMFLVKGFGISEIAELRGSAEGTVKAQLNSIYRKSGTRNKSEVLSVLLDSMMDGKSSQERPAETAETTA